jgi:hypothetical protein
MIISNDVLEKICVHGVNASLDAGEHAWDL